jgi:hypothetical protein
MLSNQPEFVLTEKKSNCVTVGIPDNSYYYEIQSDKPLAIQTPMLSNQSIDMKRNMHMNTPKIILTLLISLIGISNLLAQQDLNVLYNLDLGLPPSGLNNNRIGAKIAILGDINGDGYDDWATIGGTDYETGTAYGSVHIYLGGPERRQEATPADIIVYGNKDMMLGLGAWSAGDINADGYDDILIYGSWLDNVSNELVPTHGLYLGGDPFETEADLLFRKLDTHGGTANYSSEAGDVNNDGFDDILVSVPTTVGSPDTGHVYLYHGGQNMDNIPDVIFSGTVYPPGDVGGAENFGGANAAGDMNNDGFDDIIISSNSGGKLYFGGANMDNDLDLLFDDFRGAGTGTGPRASYAGDVNNDGFDDLLMTANIANVKAFICYGNSVVDNIPDVIIPMWREEVGIGFSASAAGDINDDGFDDLLLGTSTYWSLETGQVRIFYGGTEMDSIADISIDGTEPWHVFGFSVAGDADFDGDNYPDFLIGNIGNAATLDKHDEAGSISIFYGGETISEIADVVYTGVADEEGFGFSAAFAGDVNNDGYPDIIVGAPSHWEGPYHYAGRAYLYYGSDTPSTAPDLILNTTFVYNGYHAHFGKKVRSAGDVNGDQYSDIYIEENFKTLIFLGGAPMDSIADYAFNTPQYNYSFSAIGDVNRDGFDDILYSDPALGTGGTANLYLGGSNMMDGIDATFTGLVAGDNLGYKNSGAGDLNNDGFSDFIISVPGDDSNGSNSGAVYVFFGDTTISNTPDLVLYGHYPNQGFGSRGIAAGKDINDDGYDDIVIGDNFFSLGSASYEGRIYIYYGGSAMNNEADVVFTGKSAGMRLGKKVLVLEDLNSDGYDELLTNEGDLSNGDESTSIYFGAVSMDSIPDITLPYFVDYADFDAVRFPDNSTRFLIGDQLNNAAGWNMGRVTVYSNQIVDNVENNQSTIIPDQFSLNQNYPNPFNPQTTIEYMLPASGKVKLIVYDILGREVAVLVDRNQPAGQHMVEWEASELSSGIYFYRLESGNDVKARKMMLLK